MSPNTHGDSLGYHFVVAKSILYNGNYPLDITHIHTLLAGSGELLISIGMLLDLNSLEVWCSIQVCLAYLVFSKEPTTIKNIFSFISYHQPSNHFPFLNSQATIISCLCICSSIFNVFYYNSKKFK